ncbi:MAG TPA: exosortase-associated EpsI family protein [Tepidisphaeraceae bacterium]|nr:exosortase-associated EpsI family protein [Tepidisphaeraceae bacterium]
MAMNRRQTSWRLGRTIPLLATSAVLLALLGDRTLLRSAPAQAEPYHQAVRAAANAMPAVFGPWLGVDVPVPQAAIKMLEPNIILSRRFHNITTDETVTLLLVHVKDARDALGHYPPVCYPGQGWKTEAIRPTEWSADGRAVVGNEYEFSRERVDGGSRLTVSNFFIARGGTTCRDMDGVELTARDRQRKFYGVAQLQFVTDTGSISPQRQRQVVEEFIRYVGPTLSAVAGETGGSAAGGGGGSSSLGGA